MTRVLALSGGVGGAKMVQALTETLEDPTQVTAVCNTGDDFEHLGLHISPDVDSVMYRLGNLHDEDRGWGQRQETWNFLEALKGLGGETWFQLGDRDLATHVRRTQLLEAGESLTSATGILCQALGVSCQLAPMSDQPVRTVVETESGDLDFQHYFVRERCNPTVSGFRFAGASAAQMSPAFSRAMHSGELELIVFCPSNPFVSIDPILAIPGAEEGLLAAKARGTPIVAVSPIIGGEALKGPAAKMLGELGLEVSAHSVAAHYHQRGLLTHFVVDPADKELFGETSLEGIEVLALPALLNTPEQRQSVARAVLACGS